MKKALCLVAMLAFVASASAGIELYLTKGAAATGGPPGEKLPDAFNQNQKSFVTNYVPPSSTELHSPFIQEPCTSTETYYLWAQISGYGTGGFQIYGLDLRASYATPPDNVGQSAMYRQYTVASGARWDGAVGIPFPGQGAAVTAGGIKVPKTFWGNVDISTDFADYTKVLIAGFEFNCVECSSKLWLDLGPNFMAVRQFDEEGTLVHDWDTGPGGYYPDLTIQGVPYVQGSGVAQMAIHCIPEPASMLLLGLAGLLLRRR